MIDRPHLELHEYLPYLINRVGSALVARYEQELRRHHLSIAMWRVLVALSDNGEQRQIDIAEMTSTDVSTMSRLVTRVVRMGLATRTRSKTNNREVIVELTPKGRMLANKLIPIARKLEQSAIAGLSGAELAATRDSLRRMFQNISAGGAAPAGRKSKTG